MHIVLYTHSLVSDWNHGNAHFLRGILSELAARGHSTLALEPETGWSRTNLLKDQGDAPITLFARRFPDLRVATYGPDTDHEALVDGAGVVIVHEWTEPGIVALLGALRRRGAHFLLLFHDTHHRAVSETASLAALPIDGYDGVLAFGEALRERYIAHGWGRRVFTWHEAADTRLFRPLPPPDDRDDLVWIGNWGDDERAGELDAFLVGPARALGLTGTVHGVRYPPHALEAFQTTRLAYRGWLANALVPEVFARHRMTVHIPRGPYVTALPGIPTIRVFEALACGIPLVCAPWDDAEGLFAPTDFLRARTGEEMRDHLLALSRDPALRDDLAASGLATIRARHTCAHRVDELLAILARCGQDAPTDQPSPAETVP